MPAYARLAIALSLLTLMTAACGGGGGGGGGGGAGDGGGAATYTVGGTVSGLTGTGLVLRNNGGGDLTIAGDGAFTFTTALASGADYDVTVNTQPSGQTCAVGSGSGTVGTADVATVSVTCTTTGGGTPDTVAPTVAVANLRDGGWVQTGFLVGTASDDVGVVTVEVALDGGAYAPAVGTTAWSFALPAGAATWRDGKQHAIAVRATDAAGNPSTAVNLTVRKGANKDINGDGYPDVVVSANAYVSGLGLTIGRIYVFHSGGAAGLPATLAAGTEADTVLNGPAAGSGLGWSFAVGDVNADGYADIVAAAINTAAGTVYVFLSPGSAGFPAAVSADTGADYTFTGSIAADQFGYSVAVGDVNGDGYADVAAGNYLYNAEAGRVYVFHSGPGGMTSGDANTVANTIVTGETGSRLGNAVALGDINGDGQADLVVGAHFHNGGRGKAYVFLAGTGVGLPATLNAGTQAANTFTGAAVNHYLGDGVAIGDVNGDGYGDVLIGAFGVNSGSGRVSVYHAGSSGLLDVSADSVLDGEAGSQVGGRGRIALGDVNGDGYPDLVLGGYSYGTLTGRVYTVHSLGSAGLPATLAVGTGANSVLTGEAGSWFGLSAGAADLNGDGYADLVAGAANYSSGQGRAYVVLSTGADGLPASQNARDSNTVITGEAGNGQFGRAVSP